MTVPIIDPKLLHYSELEIKTGHIYLQIDGGKKFKLTAAYMIGAEAALKGARYDSCTFEMISNPLMQWRQGWENQTLHMMGFTGKDENPENGLPMDPPSTPEFWGHEEW